MPVLGVQLHEVSVPGAADRLLVWAARAESRYVCAANVHSLMEAHDDPDFLQVLNGADLVFVPTATAGMSRYLWEIELQAHAIDNIYYIGGVNRVGFDDGGSPDQKYYGSSFFADPKGKILAQAGDENDEIVYAELDLGMIEELRNTWGFFRDRRPDMYAKLAA